MAVTRQILLAQDISSLDFRCDTGKLRIDWEIRDNGDGTFALIDSAGNQIESSINVCSMLDSCELDALGNVIEAGKAVSDVLSWDGANWVPVAPLQFGEFQAEFDASSGSFPGDASTEPGDWWAVTVAGTIDGEFFDVGDIIVASVANPSTTTFAGNWVKIPTLTAITGLIDVSDTTTVDLNLAGLGTSTSKYVISANVIVDPAANNDLSDSGSGLFVDVQAEETITTLSYDVPSNVLTYTGEGGVTNIDLSDLQSIFDQIRVLDTNCIDLVLTGDGTQATPYELSAVPIISAAAGQLLSCEGDGLFVDATVGQLTNVAPGADAPANKGDILVWDSDVSEWVVLDMTSALDCGSITLTP